MRLIDADELLIEMGAGCLPIGEPGISGVTGGNDTIKDYIDRAPTVDAELARYGGWYEGSDAMMRCDICDRLGNPHIDRHCRGCGAKMDGKYRTC